jgi:hypothetical protein
MLSETSDLGTSDSAATLTAGDGDMGVDDSLDEGAMTPMTKGDRRTNEVLTVYHLP